MQQVRAKKSLGQHFLTDLSVARHIAESLQPDGAAAPVQVRQYAADGTLLSEAVVDAPFFRMAVSDGAAMVEVTGSLQVFEIIAK